MVLLAGCDGSPAAPPPTASPEPTAQATPQATGTPVRETGGSAPTTVPTQRAVGTDDPPGPDPGTTPHDDPSPGDSRTDRGGSTSPLRERSLDDGPTTTRGPSTDSVQGEVHTWQDGDLTRRVWVQLDLVVKPRDQIRASDIVAVEQGSRSIVRTTDQDAQGKGEPVFRSEFGELMTLPGGLLLALDPEWDSTSISRFFSAQGIAMSRVQRHVFAANGFLVETEPGFPSLELANALAGQDGVILSSPNWQSTVTPR